MAIVDIPDSTEPSVAPGEVVEWMRIPNTPGVYAVGCFESGHVTIRDQQVRACNLVWSLKSLGQLPRTAVVVGGGYSGATLSLALALSGVEVHLLERNPSVFQRQDSAYHRFLHPALGDWPRRASSDRFTNELPLLRWEAGMANAVTRSIRETWERQRPNNLAAFYQRQVVGFEHQTGATWKVRVDSGDCFGPYDAVFLATGFAEGRGFNGNRRDCLYWKPDGVEATTALSKRSVLVSGTGDGGLIDFARSVTGCMHDALFALIESHFRLGTPHMRWAANLASVLASRDMVQAQKLAHDRPDNHDLVERLTHLVRPGCEVTLGSITSEWLAANVSPLNAVLTIYLLEAIRSGGVREGRTNAVSYSSRVEVEFEDGTNSAYDEIVIRHGPDQESHELDAGISKWAEAWRVGRSSFQDPGPTPAYPVQVLGGATKLVAWLDPRKRDTALQQRGTEHLVRCYWQPAAPLKPAQLSAPAVESLVRCHVPVSTAHLLNQDAVGPHAISVVPASLTEVMYDS